MTAIPHADERAMLARTRPNAFDYLRDTCKLGLGGRYSTIVDIKSVNARRWTIGDALRRLHAEGWQSPSGSVANPLRGPEAATARAKLSDLECIVGEASWPIVVRVIIAGDSLRLCHDLLPMGARGFPSWGDEVLLDRLCLAIDRVGPLLGATS